MMHLAHSLPFARFARGSLCLLCCLLGGIAKPSFAEDLGEDWDLLGATRQHSLGVRLGNSDATNWGVSADLMLPAATELYLDYLHSDLDVPQGDEQIANYQLRFTTDPLAAWSSQLTYERSGKSSSLQTEDVGVGVQYSRNRWIAGVRYLRGKVELQTNPIASNLQPRRFELDRNGVELQLSTFTDRWQGSVRYLDYDYERSVRLNPNSLQLLRRLGLNTFQQVFGLLDWSATVEASHQREKHLWRLGYSQHALELTDESGQIPYVGWDYQLSSVLTLGVLGAVGLSDSEHYGELALGFRF